MYIPSTTLSDDFKVSLKSCIIENNGSDENGIVLKGMYFDYVIFKRAIKYCIILSRHRYK